MFQRRRQSFGTAVRPLSDSADRRAANRHVTVFKAARIEAGKGDDICLIRNISNTGLMIQTSFPLERDQHVVIEIRSDSQLEGTVRWTHDQVAGIQLDTPTNVAAMLQTPTGKARSKSRAPRFARRGTVRIKGTQSSTNAPIENISLSGACITTDASFRLHESVTVSIEGMSETAGEISWVGPHAVGVHFLQPLRFREFEAWLLRPELQPKPQVTVRPSTEG
jgi:hypothetical protein